MYLSPLRLIKSWLAIVRTLSSFVGWALMLKQLDDDHTNVYIDNSTIRIPASEGASRLGDSLSRSFVGVHVAAGKVVLKRLNDTGSSSSEDAKHCRDVSTNWSPKRMY